MDNSVCLPIHQGLSSEGRDVKIQHPSADIQSLLIKKSFIEKNELWFYAELINLIPKAYKFYTTYRIPAI